MGVMAVVGGRLSEDVPEFGAIFMSNRSTKDECFDKRVFGLPPSSANFVKNVKAGMYLFLFEYEERNLYGVFKATSDGRMNIIPQAYRSLGMSFPAQVRFCVVWRCHPLSENCFRDAIRDNYYAPNKFRFGLSQEQVWKLLCLFGSSRSRVQKPLVFENLTIKSSDRKIDFDTARISENSSSGSQLNQLQRGLDQCRSTSNNSFLLEDYTVNPGTPVKQADSRFTSKHGFTAQISKDSSSGSLLIQLQTGPECKNTSNDSLLLEDYIPLSDPEHCDPVNSGDGNDQSDSELHPKVKRQYSDELHPKVKRLYSDTKQKRRSVFSRLQCGSQEWGENSRKNINYPSHSKWDSESSSFEQENERKSGVPQSVHRIMKWRREKWMAEDITPSQKTNVFSRISFPPEFPMYDRDGEVNSLSRLNSTYNASSYLKEANKNAKKRSHQVPFPDHSDSKNISLSIQVEMLGNAERVEVNLKDSSSPVNVKLASHHQDFNHVHERRTLKTLNVIGEMDSRQVFKEPFPEDEQHKRKKLMRSTGSDFSNRIVAAPCPVASKGGTKKALRLRD
ncbi:uncharacterized protein LOC115999681 isoform X1 [Ipomoea triloba]|uniref:uncharacterized protein LOC115999681 isoform X1 n=2 Tax=Ipomoea triloba TaxID=35885 RepID=UPI00125D55B0|nr:uncharacterized protein LOC115999681 isoform X1 [Ipomoea triloba]XP_031095400.1 uncharacterized protein LOC115999681 isoform X1 [Ipomoea triloba]